MIISEYKLSNGSDTPPGRPNVVEQVFDISKNAYRIKITPRSAFWQLGFRFSQSESIYFEAAEDNFGWRPGPFRDLYIAAEQVPGDATKGQLTVTLNNFEAGGEFPEIPGSYDEKKQVTLYLKFIPRLNQLYISYTVEAAESVELLLPLYTDYKYLQLFGWFYKMYYALELSVETISFEEIEFDASPFKVGGITFRLGDMFNKEVRTRTNLIILPASGNGTVNPNIYYRASELNIPLPEKMKPGSIKLFDISQRGNKLFAGYGYSVDNDRSSTEIISAFCRALDDALLEINPDYDLISGINLPLLGTGAGRMDPRNVARIYDHSFNAPNFGVPVVVSIPSGDVFQRVKTMFFAELIPIGHSNPAPKPESVAELERELQILLEDEEFEVNEQGELTRLDLSSQIAIDLSALKGHRDLEYLNLNYCALSGRDNIGKLKNLRNLYLRGTGIHDFNFLADLEHLTTLDVGDNELSDLSAVTAYGTELRRLYAGRNLITETDELFRCQSLEFLDLCNNYLTEIPSLRKLRNLKSLLLAGNQIASLDGLEGSKSLVILNIRNNRVNDFSVLLTLKNLNYLTADKNPATKQAELLLNDGENHLSPIKSFYARQAETGKIPVDLPAKVLLLGNHGSGKSSLLHYMRFKTTGSGLDSTHIIKIEHYCIGKKKKKIPDAIFFDFGGQDYYHGLYRAFLSNGALYLILWSEAHNKNGLREEPTTGWTQDFSLIYWLAQKKYLENEKFEGVIDTTLLVQTFADRDKRSGTQLAARDLVENDFYISLTKDLPRVSPSGLYAIVNHKALDYLATAINELIVQKKQHKEEPKWYHDFLAYILSQNTSNDYQGKSIVQLAGHYTYTGADKQERLEADLQQLHRQGLILYYKDHLPDIAWLSPAAFVKHVHDTLLSKADLVKFAGKIPVAEFPIGDENIIALLTKQKVIFYHEAQQQYIVPNFLPLVRQTLSGTDLLTFGLSEPIFVLKFKAFIPFGLINQIICFFGGLPAEKQFWRDRVLFVLDNCVKVMINVDFQLMEIKVYRELIGQIVAGDKEGIISYLFYCIVGLYWDLQLLGLHDFRKFWDEKLKKGAFAEGDPMHTKITDAEKFYQKEACRPADLYISLDYKHFIFYRDLCTAQEMIMIAAHSVKERDLLDQSKSIPIYQFQPFTRNPLRKRRKMVISYSKEDFSLVQKFIDYLVPLSDDELVEDPWYCSQLEAGSDWNEEIQKRFNDADIIFFMISENLMKIPYVKEHEIKHAIDRYRKYGKVKIVPIILQPYHWARKGDYNLAMFTGLPYKLTPVANFRNQNEAWHIISESIRIMINKNLDPGLPDVLDNELKRYFERIVDQTI